MAFKLEWSEEALEDIESIATYIEKDSPIYAKSVVSKFLTRSTAPLWNTYQTPNTKTALHNFTAYYPKFPYHLSIGTLVIHHRKVA